MWTPACWIKDDWFRIKSLNPAKFPMQTLIMPIATGNGLCKGFLWVLQREEWGQTVVCHNVQELADNVTVGLRVGRKIKGLGNLHNSFLLADMFCSILFVLLLHEWARRSCSRSRNMTTNQNLTDWKKLFSWQVMKASLPLLSSTYSPPERSHLLAAAITAHSTCCSVLIMLNTTRCVACAAYIQGRCVCCSYLFSVFVPDLQSEKKLEK